MPEKRLTNDELKILFAAYEQRLRTAPGGRWRIEEADRTYAPDHKTRRSLISRRYLTYPGRWDDPRDLERSYNAMVPTMRGMAALEEVGLIRP